VEQESAEEGFHCAADSACIGASSSSAESSTSSTKGSSPGSGSASAWVEREFFVDNLLVRIHFIIGMIRWTGLAPWDRVQPRVRQRLQCLV